VVAITTDLCLYASAYHISSLHYIGPVLNASSEPHFCSAVLDEIDILFNDENFEASLQGLINSSPVTTQYLFVTATLPVDVCNKLIEVFPDCEVIMGPGVHRTSARLEEVGFLLLFPPILTTTHNIREPSWC
jgi:hypothetical protein